MSSFAIIVYIEIHLQLNFQIALYHHFHYWIIDCWSSKRLFAHSPDSMGQTQV